MSPPPSRDARLFFNLWNNLDFAKPSQELKVYAAGQTGLDPCKQAYSDCENQWVDRTQAAQTDGERCDSALQWDACLLRALSDGLCSGTESSPREIQQEKEIYCEETEDCKEAQEKCKQDYDYNKKSDKCGAAKDWKKCNDDAQKTGTCQSVPQQVLDEEQNSCEAAKSGSECLNAVNKCSDEWQMKYDDDHPNVLKCRLAQDWAACLKNAIVFKCETESVTFPREVIVQEMYCDAPDQEVDFCKEGKDICEDAWSPKLKAVKTEAERCDTARSWRDCLNDASLLERCPSGVDIPVDVEETIIRYCVAERKQAGDSCSVLEEECARAYLISRDNRRNKCDISQQWQQCLKEAEAKGCGIAVPATLQEELDICKNEDLECPAEMARCKAEFDSQDPSLDRCAQAQKWRACLENLVDVCTFQFPTSLHQMEASSCYIQKSSECLSKETQCKKQYLDNVAVTGESCVLVEQWKECLEQLVDDKGCDTQVPMEVFRAEVRLCYAAAGGGQSCADEQAKCKRAFDSAPTADPCNNAKAWRSCLEALMGKCNVNFPFKLNAAEATSCYVPGTSSFSDSRDAGGAKLTCKKREQRCRAKSVVSERKRTRCDQAKKWRSCLEGLTGECKVEFPVELNQLQAFHCYPAPSQPDPSDTTSDKSKCNKKQDKCKTNALKSKASACDQAKDWRSCLDDLLDECTVEYPFALNQLQALNCDSSSGDQNQGGKDDSKKDDSKRDDSKKKDDSSNSCEKKAKNCKPKKAKTCDDAQQWRSCLDKLKDECGMGIYTSDLNTLQSNTCYDK
ncbi:hypothetical protein PoB_003118900 [Plakobranchus ocellatus]|uniref:Uncharacterized protein n=1 Tax=Plakobranchus ocellatus TaxID=259542 RepID=A0AAV4AAJ7_9GAST|nr:hypothetical protein PoB_003118900 [Plakobranchus ocellatus]